MWMEAGKEELRELQLERELLTGESVGLSSPSHAGLAPGGGRGDRAGPGDPACSFAAQRPQHQATFTQKGSVSRGKWGGGVVAVEAPWAGCQLGGWAGNEEVSVICLLFDVLDGNGQLWTRGLVRRGHVEMLFLYTHGND